MTDDRMIAAIGLVAFLILVMGGLVRRRMPTRKWLGLGLAWIGIFVLATVVATIGLHLRR